MQVDRRRIACLIIAYLHVISSLVDVSFHLIFLSLVTNGFQCEVDEQTLASLNWPWLQPVLLILNLGTHGFYPFPVILSSMNNAFEEYSYMSILKRPKCFPGIFHVNMVDVLIVLINTIWLRLVISFVVAVHKKNLNQIKMFYAISIAKVLLQVLYLIFQPDFHAYASTSTWFLEMLDISLAAIIIIIIGGYVRSLRAEKIQAGNDQPPSYVECLITTMNSTNGIKKIENEAPIESKKKEDAPAILPI